MEFLYVPSIVLRKDRLPIIDHRYQHQSIVSTSHTYVALGVCWRFHRSNKLSIALSIRQSIYIYICMYVCMYVCMYITDDCNGLRSADPILLEVGNRGSIAQTLNPPSCDLRLQFAFKALRPIFQRKFLILLRIEEPFFLQ